MACRSQNCVGLIRSGLCGLLSRQRDIKIHFGSSGSAALAGLSGELASGFLETPSFSVFGSLARICLAVLLCFSVAPSGLATADLKEKSKAVAIDQRQPEVDERLGFAVRINLPITGQTVDRVRRYVRNVMAELRGKKVHPIFILELQTIAGQNEFGRGSKFGDAYELANFLSGEELNAATTVAYIPKSIQGNSLLVVIACDEIIMAPDAKMGAAGVDEQIITPPLRSAYKEIAGRRKTVPAEIALGMLDKQREVLDVQTELSREFVTTEGLKNLEARRTIKSKKVLIPKGEFGEFSGTEGRLLGIVAYLAWNRRDVAKALELPPIALEEDPSFGGDWTAARVDLRGPINASQVKSVQLMIEEAVNKNRVNFICLWIDSPGGSPVDSLELARFLVFDLDSSRVRVVAYIPSEARSDAGVIAMACDQVVMLPNAIIGGFGAYQFTEREAEQAKEVIQREIAPRKSRSWSLIAALVDAKLDVYQYTKSNEVEFFCDEELQEQPKPGDWKRGPLVTRPGQPFQVRGRRAASEFRIVNYTVDDFVGFKRLYGLESDPQLMEPDWADFLIRALASPGLAVALLIVGMSAFYAELHAPGIGIGGFVATVCFLLFFWSRFLGGTAGWLEAMLFLAGICFILLEVFVLPGFGIFGLGGGMLVMASLILTGQTFIVPHNEYQFGQLQKSLFVLAGAAAGGFVAILGLRRWLPYAPMFNQVVLQPPVGREGEVIKRKESLVDFDDMIGERGVTATQLTPGGKARFGNRLIAVISDGELIEPGVWIVVIEVHGSRVVVREVDGPSTV